MTQLWWLSWVTYSDYPGGHQVYSVLCVRITIDELRRTHVMNESPQCLPFAFCVYGEILRNFLLHPSHHIVKSLKSTTIHGQHELARFWTSFESDCSLSLSRQSIFISFGERWVGTKENPSWQAHSPKIYAMRTSNSKHFRAYIGIPVLTWTDMWKTLCMHNRTARPNEN